MSNVDRFPSSFPALRGSVAVTAASVTLHVAALALLWLLYLWSQPGLTGPRFVPPRPHIHLTLPQSLLRTSNRLQGGGGGGEHSLTPPTRGAAPPSSPVKTFVAPTPVTTITPRLPVEPTLLNAEAPKIDLNQYGDPTSSFAGLSFGQGTAGIGTNGVGGLGDRNGPGYKGNGSDGGSGGRVYSGGEGASMPVLIYKIEPEYSEQARQAKMSGSVQLRLVVDQNGLPRSIKVSRPLGLGLDEKAIDAVKLWRFRPGMKDGHAVAVEATVELIFRLL